LSHYPNYFYHNNKKGKKKKNGGEIVREILKIEAFSRKTDSKPKAPPESSEHPEHSHFLADYIKHKHNR